MSKTVGLILGLEDKASPQLQKIADKMGLTIKEAKALHTQVSKVAKSMKEDLAKVGKALVVGFGAVTATATVLVNKSVEAGDRIDKMSQKMQMSRKTFQELEYVFSQNGANIEIMNTGMAKLSKTIDGARIGTKKNVATFKALGISLKDSSGKIKSTEKVMFEAIARLQKMPEGARKSALAMELFGKSANELAPLLNGSAKGVEELRKKFNDLGMGMSDEQVDAAIKFKDSMDTIQRAFEGLGNQIGADLLPMIQEVADKIIENMPKIKETVTPILQGICEVVKFVIDNFETLKIVTISVASSFVAFKVLTTINTLWLAYTAVVKNATLAQQMMNIVMNMNPIMRLITIISTGIGFIVMLEMKTKILTNTFKKLGEVVGKVWDKMHQAQPTSYTLPAQEKKSDDSKPKVNKYASGTLYAQGGNALINEKGAELVELPEGSKVMTANATKQMLGGGNYTVNLNIAGNVIGNNEFIQQVSNALGRQLKTAMAC